MWHPAAKRGRCFRSFFFQAEDGIRDHCVTGVQTCALPISRWPRAANVERSCASGWHWRERSEERRVGKESRAGRASDDHRIKYDVVRGEAVDETPIWEALSGLALTRGVPSGAEGLARRTVA